MCTNFEGKKIFSSSLCVVFITLTKETTTTTTVVTKLEIFGLERTPEIQLLHHCSTSTVNDHCCSMFTLSDGIIICLSSLWLRIALRSLLDLRLFFLFSRWDLHANLNSKHHTNFSSLLVSRVEFMFSYVCVSLVTTFIARETFKGKEKNSIFN